MLTLLLSLLAMAGFWVGFHYGLQWGAWGVVLSILLGSGLFMGGMYLIRRRITAIMAAIQARITERNNSLMRKYQQLGSRPGGNVKQLMDQARRDQDAILSEALEATQKMEPYAKWSLLLDRQINAIRLQFLYQLRRFDEVDRILPKTLFADPVLCCMKMCRQYKRGEDAALKKSYDKYRKKYKFDATLIYATYAWMLLRKKQKDEARQVLLDGKKATENEILEKNWEHVTNDRLNQFSNAELGESWYALLLEEPKQPKPRVQRQVQRRRF
jgi:hypothetical protein